MQRLIRSEGMVEAWLSNIEKKEELLIREAIKKLTNPNPTKKYRAIYASQYGNKNAEISEIVECAEFDHPNYIALKKLGEGGSGKVFLTRRVIGGEITNVELAAKVFKLNQLHPIIKGERERRELKQLMINEFTKLAYVQHPNILKTFVPEDFHETFLLPMEYMNGGNLEELLNELSSDYMCDIKFLPLLQTMIPGIAEGVDYLHRNGYVLRDLKLKNMLTNQTLKKVKLGDFETITSIEELQTSNRFTIGSNMYAAPELIRGEKATQSSDAYALGACIYYILSREKPSDNGFIATLNRIQDRREYDRILRKRLMKIQQSALQIEEKIEARKNDIGPEEYEILYETAETVSEYVPPLTSILHRLLAFKPDWRTFRNIHSRIQSFQNDYRRAKERNINLVFIP